MAIIKTGKIYKTLTFAGINSGDYGVYITQQAAYDAPKRDASTIVIPGRNGDYIVDNGRFENVEVTYHCGIFGKNQKEYATAIQNFRNAIAPFTGYQRLTDGYNEDEYRMAQFTGEIKVSTVQSRAGEFDIVFNCMPQRFLLSGEKVTLINKDKGEGYDKVTNPTNFDSHPILRSAGGAGTITVNGEQIVLSAPAKTNINMGEPTNSTVNGQVVAASFIIPFATMTADNIVIDDLKIVSQISNPDWAYKGTVQNARQSIIPDLPNFFPTAPTVEVDNSAVGNTLTLTFSCGKLDLSTTVEPHATSEWTFYLPLTEADGTEGGISQTFNAELSYYMVDGWVRGIQLDLTRLGAQQRISTTLQASAPYQTVTGEDLLSHNTTNIDTELGIAWVTILRNGKEIASINLNDFVTFPLDLPVLKPGENSVDYDGDIWFVAVVPRWWIV